MPLPAGTRLGRYEVRSPLGAGGMGEVYLAWDSELERQVALKVLPPDVAPDRQRLNRFIQEAKAASALNHPNILSIYDAGEADSTRFIVMEHVEGETLRQHMSGGRLDLREALDVSAQVASALAEAHQVGIVHRDIKPENVMLRRGGIAKVLDFGIAKLRERSPLTADTEAQTRELVNTGPGAIIGTVSYMSPEQARGLEVDARTDIWSLGVVLYEMLSGRVPFEGETATDVLADILHREPASLRLYRQDVPAELERIVEKALTKDREERYQVVKDMALDLRRLRQRLDVEAEIERSAAPDRGGAGIGAVPGGQPTETGHLAAAGTGGAGDARTTSSAEYVITEIKRHGRAAFMILAALALAVSAVAYFTYSRYPAGGGGDVIRSVAVLPFQNAGGDPNTEYLSDGISESLINSLSRLPGVKVIARSSSFKYKGKEVDPQEVAQVLGVVGILTGRVTQRGENLFISVELIDARDRTQVWGEQYNRRASDLLQIQSDISEEIAEKLRLRLSAGDKQQLARRETANPQAYELLLKGRFTGVKVGTENRRKAAEYFQQAIAIDPNYALAHAELSLAYLNLVGFSSFDPKEFMPKAEAAARKALDLDANLAEAPYALATIERYSWQWASSEHGYKRAIELNPNLARAHNGYALYLSLMGRHDEAIAGIKRARELDPLSPLLNLNVSTILYYARRYDEAIEALQKTLELDQNNPFVHDLLGRAYAAKAMHAEAIAAYREAIKLGEGTPRTQISLGAAYAKAGDREQARAILRRMQTSNAYVSPAELAILYAALGEREQAFAALEKAYAARDLQLQYLKVSPAYDSLRDDPRFQGLLRRVGFML